jgi:hypothetical protein
LALTLSEGAPMLPAKLSVCDGSEVSKLGGCVCSAIKFTFIVVS